MKACPGLRSWIDRSGSLSLVIRGIPWSFVRKCAYAAFERAVEPLHSAISSFRPLNSSFPRRRESRAPPLRHSRESGNPEGRCGLWQQHQNSPTNQCTQFSYLVTPASVVIPSHSSCRPPTRHSGEGRCGLWQQHQNSPTNQCTQFSYLVTPASVVIPSHSSCRPPTRHSGEGRNPEGRGGARQYRRQSRHESMSRTPIRDAPSNRPPSRLSAGETCRIVDRWSMAE